MTEQDTTTVDTDPAPADTDANGAAPTDAPQGQGNREARYRVERNEARAEVANLQARLAIIQRAEIERLASAGLSHPSDIFTLSGNELADYLTEDGDVDTEKVSADVASILGERPGLKPPAPAVDRTQGHGGSTGRGVPSFSDLLSS